MDIKREFAHAFTGSIDHMVLLATGAREMPWNKAIHEEVRLTLKADPTLEQGDGSQGLQAARAIGMLNYRTAAQFNDAQPDDSEVWKILRRLLYQVPWPKVGG